MIVYKVVRKRNGVYFSAIIPRKFGGLKYELNKTTVPEIKGSSIMAFDTLEHATRFILKQKKTVRYNYYILKCRATQTKLLPPAFISGYLESIKKFWELYLDSEYIDYFTSAYIPKGTVFCSKLTPYKLVEIMEE